jgi:threonine dehydrogenase-like Zn-dependent dehydrogenase
MKALWLDRGSLELRDRWQAPPKAPGDVEVRVLKAGICGTDLALLDGLYPFTGVPGHEFVGLVEQGPEGLVGKRVVGEINLPCGRCEQCIAGSPKHCQARDALGIRRRHGAFAEYLYLPEANLHPVPPGLSDDAAVFTEPLAAAMDAVQKARLQGGERALVVGAGRLGQLICRVLRLCNAQVTVLGRDAAKLARLEGIADPIAEPNQVREGSFDLAVECSGSPAGMPIALKALKPRGTLVMKSTCADPVELDASRLVVDEIRLLGSRCGPFPEALALLADGRVQVESLIDARFPLSEGIEAFARCRSPGVLKVLLEPDRAT